MWWESRACPWTWLMSAWILIGSFTSRLSWQLLIPAFSWPWCTLVVVVPSLHATITKETCTEILAPSHHEHGHLGREPAHGSTFSLCLSLFGFLSGFCLDRQGKGRKERRKGRKEKKKGEVAENIYLICLSGWSEQSLEWGGFKQQHSLSRSTEGQGSELEGLEELCFPWGVLGRRHFLVSMKMLRGSAPPNSTSPFTVFPVAMAVSASRILSHVHLNPHLTVLTEMPGILG